MGTYPQPRPLCPTSLSQGSSAPIPPPVFCSQCPWLSIWQPLAEARHPSSLDFPAATYLYQVNLAFPSITLFRGSAHHKGTVFPSDHFQATTLGVGPLPVCAVAGSTDPTPEAPFGFLLFSFQRSISYVLHSCPSYVHACFEGTLVISDVYDFLDGRCIYLYGHLHFEGDNLFIHQQSYHTEDLCCSVPHLLHFCFAPCIPLDPFTLISAYPENIPI